MQRKTFSDRLRALRGADSYIALAERLEGAGIKISPQALHKWEKGGGITPENLQALGRFFDVSPALLYFGKEERQLDVSDRAILLARAWDRMPAKYANVALHEVLRIARAWIPQGDALRRQIEAELGEK